MSANLAVSWPSIMGQGFDTTRWSMVLAARDGTDEAARRALGSLCEAYWMPVYAYIRRRGHGSDEAADLTQGYFALLLEKNFLASVRPELGRFRSFLLRSVQHFLSNERDRERAVKRGGGQIPVSLSAVDSEGRLALEPRDDRTPEVAFERQWAVTLLERTMARLTREATEKGRAPQLEILKAFLTEAGPAPSYGEAAARLRTSEAALRVAVHRLRRRFGEALRSEISETVADPAEVDAEIRHLFASLESPRSGAP